MALQIVGRGSDRLFVMAGCVVVYLRYLDRRQLVEFRALAQLGYRACLGDKRSWVQIPPARQTFHHCLVFTFCKRSFLVLEAL